MEQTMTTDLQQEVLSNICCYSNTPEELEQVSKNLFFPFHFKDNWLDLQDQLWGVEQRPDLILFELNQETTEDFKQIRYLMLKDPELRKIPFIVLSYYPSLRWLKMCKKFEVADYIMLPFADQYLRHRLEKLVSKPNVKNKLPEISWHLPWWKRLMDVAGSAGLLLLLSPVLIIIALLIKLESPGPVFYVSKRAGQGFRIFDFIKFRSMRPDADQLVDAMKDLNQYSNSDEQDKQEDLVLRSKPTDDEHTVLIKDDAYIFEAEQQEEEESSTFFKVKDDPRITRIGQFIRNTSLDELPQLFNVLKGDMSLVGNRPLPLYEAEQLTADEAVLRFAAPAGITGLWQVSKRGKGDMSEEERKQLDIHYALHYNFLMDVNILWRTLPAAIQEEAV
jgi:lipopolysaccharide/colanic/teichoic acid biosynthesis glycosyltransferase